MVKMIKWYLDEKVVTPRTAFGISVLTLAASYGIWTFVASFFILVALGILLREIADRAK